MGINCPGVVVVLLVCVSCSWGHEHWDRPQVVRERPTNVSMIELRRGEPAAGVAPPGDPRALQAAHPEHPEGRREGEPRLRWPISEMMNRIGWDWFGNNSQEIKRLKDTMRLRKQGLTNAVPTNTVNSP
jgi:hypothetical protein